MRQQNTNGSIKLQNSLFYVFNIVAFSSCGTYADSLYYYLTIIMLHSTSIFISLHIRLSLSAGKSISF